MFLIAKVLEEIDIIDKLIDLYDCVTSHLQREILFGKWLLDLPVDWMQRFA